MKKKLFLFLLLLGLLLGGCIKKDEEGKFVIDEVTTSALEDGKNYYIITAIRWTGNDNVIINDIDLLHAESNIQYQFYAGESGKKLGVYKRDKEDMGELKDIKDWTIEKEGVLIMSFQLEDVKKNPKRQIKILYTVNDKQQEQIIDSSTIQNLYTTAK